MKTLFCLHHQPVIKAWITIGWPCLAFWARAPTEGGIKAVRQTTRDSEISIFNKIRKTIFHLDENCPACPFFLFPTILKLLRNQEITDDPPPTNRHSMYTHLHTYTEQNTFFRRQKSHYSCLHIVSGSIMICHHHAYILLTDWKGLDFKTPSYTKWFFSFWNWAVNNNPRKVILFLLIHSQHTSVKTFISDSSNSPIKS